jgi:hypothetical protein
MTIYLVTIGVIVCCGALAQIRSVYPGFQKQLQTSALWAKLQQYIFLPALFGSRRLQPATGNTGYIPGRALSIFIAIYIILNVVLSSVSFQTFSPSMYWNSPQFELCEYVGNRTGTLSLVNMSMAILFAGRNNLLIIWTGWNQTTFLTLHRWTARVATVQAVVHSIVYTLAYFEPGYDGASAYAAEVVLPFYVCFSLLNLLSHVPVWFPGTPFLSYMHHLTCFENRSHALTVVGDYRNNCLLLSDRFGNPTIPYEILRDIPRHPYHTRHPRFDRMLVPFGPPFRICLWLSNLALHLLRVLVFRPSCQNSAYRLLQSSKRFEGNRGSHSRF